MIKGPIRLINQAIIHKSLFQSSSLKNVFSNNLTQLRSHFKSLQTKYGDHEIQKVKVHHILNGMKDLPGYFHATSTTDPYENLLYHGRSIDKLSPELSLNGEYDQPQLEATLFYLLTGQMPNNMQTKELTNFLRERGK